MTKIEEEMRRIHAAVQAVLPEGAVFACIWQTEEPGNGGIVGNAPPFLVRHFGSVLAKTEDDTAQGMTTVDVSGDGPQVGNC